jgi:hypothetical protein
MADWLTTDRYIGRQAVRKTNKQADKQTGKKTDRKIYRLQNIYQYRIVLFSLTVNTVCMLYQQMVLHAQYYTGGGGGTLGPKSSYFCTESVFKCLHVHKVKNQVKNHKIKKFLIHTPVSTKWTNLLASKKHTYGIDKTLIMSYLKTRKLNS